MRQLAFLALTSTAQLLIAQPAISQANRFSNEFESQVFRSCVGSFRNATNANREYCNCYAQEFVDRYNPEQLRAIGQAVRNLNNQSTTNQVVVAFMSPEIKLCKSLSSLEEPN